VAGAMTPAIEAVKLLSSVRAGTGEQHLNVTGRPRLLPEEILVTISPGACVPVKRWSCDRRKEIQMQKPWHHASPLPCAQYAQRRGGSGCRRSRKLPAGGPAAGVHQDQSDARPVACARQQSAGLANDLPVKFQRQKFGRDLGRRQGNVPDQLVFGHRAGSQP